MSLPTGVDSSAPVLAHHEIDVNAALDTIWRLHTDVDAWPQWQTDIKRAHLEGGLAVGGAFSWSSFSFTGTCTIYTVVDHWRLLWGGTAGDLTDRQDWVFSPIAGRRVHVCTTASFAGAAAQADPAGMQFALDVSLASWLTLLKKTAEAREPAPARATPPAPHPVSSPLP